MTARDSLLVQMAYDSAARAMSNGRESLYDTWRLLLGASYRRGESRVNSADFLASSKEAHRVVKGFLDGTLVPQVVVQSLAYAWD